MKTTLRILAGAGAFALALLYAPLAFAQMPVPSGVFAPGDVIYAPTDDDLDGIAPSTAGQALISNGAGVAPSFQDLYKADAWSGRGFFTICGEATTINNNTIYYGPSDTLTANIPGGVACSIDATGNATEATADAPVLPVAFHVLGMWCRNEADANADISYTLRTAAGPTVPSVTCTIADNERACVADVQTTTPIAAGATVAIAAASTGNIGDNNGFVCTVSIAY